MHFLQLSILSYAFSHFEFHFGETAGTDLGAEHSIDGVKAAMEMHAVFYKNELTLAQETAAADAAADPTLNGVAAATPTGANGGYSRAVIGTTTAPVDPAGVAVIAYQIDVRFSFPLSALINRCVSSGWRQQS